MSKPYTAPFAPAGGESKGVASKVAKWTKAFFKSAYSNAPLSTALASSLWLSYVFDVLSGVFERLPCDADENGILGRFWSIYPRTFKGLLGVAMAPFADDSADNVFKMSVALLLMGWAINIAVGGRGTLLRTIVIGAVVPLLLLLFLLLHADSPILQC